MTQEAVDKAQEAMKPKSLKQQVESRLEQLQLAQKQAESKYFEITGMISECKNTLSLINASEQPL